MRLFARFAAIVIAFLIAHSAGAQPELRDVRRKNLGSAINTTSIEILPFVSPDGSTLYFDRKFHPDNIGGTDDEDDIYFSTRIGDSAWSTAVNAGEPLNSKGSDVLFWISSDGNTALLHSGIDINGKPLGMAIARRTGDRWSRPVPLQINGVTALGEHYYAFITPDRKHLLLAYPRAGARDLDLYVCKAIGSDLLRWGTPLNLGPTINTAGEEGAPFFAADDRTLYFGSDGRGGMGSSDLYVARRLDTTWTSWSEPKNLGGSINTPLFDASISIPADGSAMYISGAGFIDEASFGKSDIYMVPLPQQYRPAAVVTVNGVLKARGRGIQGLVRAERVADRQEVASTVSGSDGTFTFTLPVGVEYRLTGGADGFTEGTTNIDARGVTSAKHVRATIELAGAPSAAEGGSLDVGIYFASGSAELGSDAIKGLERALSTLRRDGTSGVVTRISVIGNTDDVGSDESNIELSRRRAEAARDWLVTHGIDASLVTIVANGESRPVAPNISVRGRAQNRRVDVQYVVERVRTD